MQSVDEFLQTQQPQEPQLQSVESLSPTSKGMQSVDEFLQPEETPSNVTEARSLTGNTDYNGWCQSFAEDVTKSGWKGGTAIEAFNNYQKEGKATNDVEHARPGDLIYFQPDVSNKGAGHVGILTGKGNFISATDNGVQEMPLSDWEKLTGQQVAGIVPLSAIRQSN